MQPVEEEVKETQIQSQAQKILDKRAGIKKKGVDPEQEAAASEAQRLVVLAQKEIETYGRSDIWISYYNP